MVVSYGFFDSINGDRKYRAEDLNMIVHGLVTDGVYSNVGDKFKVTPVAGYNAVNVGTGRAWFDNKWLHNDSRYRIDLEPSDPVNPRIDAITIQVHPKRRYCVLAKVDGVPAPNPQRPTIKKDPSDYMGYPVAYIRRPAKANTVSEGDITYVVGTSECPYIASLQGSFDVDAYLQNFQNQFDQWLNNLQIPPGVNPNPDQGGGGSGSGSYPQADWASWLEARKGEWDNWFTQQKTDLPRNWNTWLEEKKSACSTEWNQWFQQKKGSLDEDWENYRNGKDIDWTDFKNKREQNWTQYKVLKDNDWKQFKNDKNQEFQDWLSQQNPGGGQQPPPPQPPPSTGGTGVQVTEETLHSLLDFSPNSKNSFYRGKNLGTVFTDEQARAIKSGTFKDLFIGDYWTGGGIIWTIAHFNYYYGHGSNNGVNSRRVNHIVVIGNIGSNGQNGRMYNDTNISAAYKGSLIHSNRGDTERKHRALFGDKRKDVSCYEPGTVGSNGEITSMHHRSNLLTLPTVGQLTGERINKPWSSYEDRQLALFALKPEMISIYDWHQWTRDVSGNSGFYAITPGNMPVHKEANDTHRYRYMGVIVGSD